MITVKLLATAMPKAPAALWGPPLAGAMAEFDIDTPLRSSAFLAQLAHESCELTRLEENLDYTHASDIVRVFRAFDLNKDRAVEPEEIAFAQAFVRQPAKLANHAYAGRNGNGDESTGDGWRFRGRCPIQLTGRTNYRAAGAALGLQLEVYPESALAPMIGSRIAGWFWKTHQLNALADVGDFTGITRIINGALTGLAARQAYYATLINLLGSPAVV